MKGTDTPRADHPLTPMERRPLASRRMPIWIKTAAVLARGGVAPNAISLAGMVGGIVTGCLFAAAGQVDSSLARRVCWVAGTLLIQFRLLCNLLDGMVAVEGGKRSPTGELYNEVPDRVSDAFTLIGIGLAPGGDLVLGGVAALLAVFVAYVRAACKIAGAPQDYCGPMAKQHRMFLATLLGFYCGLTPGAWQQVVVGETKTGAAEIVLWIIVIGGIITAIRRLVRAARYLNSQ